MDKINKLNTFPNKSIYNDIDNRILKIVEKMQKLPSKNPDFPCGEFPPKWKPPLSEKQVENFEKNNNIKLPEDYRKFITTVASSGTQPFYGLYSLTEKKPIYQPNSIINKPFPYTIKEPLFVFNMSDEEYKQFFINDEYDDINLQGYIVLCTEGCGMDSILIVNTEDRETYGTVWFFDLCNDFGIAPIFNPKNKKPMTFLDWFEYWLDQTLELPDEKFFSYISLTEYTEK